MKKLIVSLALVCLIAVVVAPTAQSGRLWGEKALTATLGFRMVPIEQGPEIQRCHVYTDGTGSIVFVSSEDGKGGGANTARQKFPDPAIGEAIFQIRDQGWVTFELAGADVDSFLYIKTTGTEALVRWEVE
jgi:hypothetical protein